MYYYLHIVNGSINEKTSKKKSKRKVKGDALGYLDKGYTVTLLKTHTKE